MPELQRLAMFFEKFYGMSPEEASRQARFYLDQPDNPMGQQFVRDSSQVNMMQDGQVPITKPTVSDIAGLQTPDYSGPAGGPPDLKKLHDVGAANSSKGKQRDVAKGRVSGKRVTSDY